MAARFRICVSWLGGIVAVLAFLCLLGLEVSTASIAPEGAALSAPHARTQIVLAAQPDCAQGTGHRDSGNESHDKQGDQNSCCASVTCSGPGMTSAAASLFVMPVTISRRAVSLGRLIPFEQSPCERPPRAA
ncbi:MAG: hypothetical protein ACOZAM_04285 [Pseudomonadota bacterium]